MIDLVRPPSNLQDSRKAKAAATKASASTKQSPHIIKNLKIWVIKRAKRGRKRGNKGKKQGGKGGSKDLGQRGKQGGIGGTVGQKWFGEKKIGSTMQRNKLADPRVNE
jgi:hypothetical protein